MWLVTTLRLTAQLMVDGPHVKARVRARVSPFGICDG
jgi:hypothetical protein